MNWLNYVTSNRSSRQKLLNRRPRSERDPPECGKHRKHYWYTQSLSLSARTGKGNRETDRELVELGNVLKLCDQMLRRKVARNLNVCEFLCDEGESGGE